MERLTGEWANVRIDKSTHAALLLVKQRMENARENGQGNHYAYSDRFGVTMDEVIRELIRRDEAHGKRSVKGRQAAKNNREAQSTPESDSAS